MFVRADLNQEAKEFASEIYNRSWRFIERDPVLEGVDRDRMQEDLSSFILRTVRAGDTHPLGVANQAIGAIRQKYDRRPVGVHR